MSRILYILIIALSCLALSASVWAGEPKEVQEVRELLYREIEGHEKGDPDQIISCYAPGFVGYWAMTEDPEDWGIWVVGLDSLRTKYAEPTRNMPAWLARHPEVTFGREVRHVHAMGDHAIAVTKHFNVIPDSTARETIRNEHQSVWMLAKIKGEWKITSWIGGVTGRQQVTKMAPR